MLSLQLHVADNSIGALNLYARRPTAFTPESEQIGLLFAIHAALAIADARRREHLTRAINSRDLIGQAKGILMERHKITGDQAFAVLVRTSQAANIKLAEVATRLVETGELVTVPPCCPDSFLRCDIVGQSNDSVRLAVHGEVDADNAEHLTHLLSAAGNAGAEQIV